jgi:hypothetical protein
MDTNNYTKNLKSIQKQSIILVFALRNSLNLRNLNELLELHIGLYAGYT